MNSGLVINDLWALWVQTNPDSFFPNFILEIKRTIGNKHAPEYLHVMNEFSTIKLQEKPEAIHQILHIPNCVIEKKLPP